jgi:hypothetical protein
MAKHHWWLKAAVSLLAVCLLSRDAGSAMGGPGYLPAVGPVPVWFRTPSRVVPVVLWPPLLQPEQQTVKREAQMTNAPAIEAPRMESLTNALPPSTTAASLPAISPPPEMVIPFSLPAPSQPGQATDDVVDPQVLLNYLLSVSTNEPGAKVIMPVFIPPAPPLLYPSSHATYESQ